MKATADITSKRRARTFGTAVDRWASVGPYYAMFPLDFAYEIVKRYTQPGDRVLDPFVGRGSSIYAAAADWTDRVRDRDQPGRVGIQHSQAAAHDAGAGSPAAS